MDKLKKKSGVYGEESTAEVSVGGYFAVGALHLLSLVAVVGAGVVEGGCGVWCWKSVGY